MMKIAHVSAAMHYGGAERVLVELATAHAGDGVRVAIIAPPGRLDRDWHALGIERMLIPSAERDPVDLARAARCVRSALRGWSPDVVHAHNVKATAMSLTGARGISARTPVLTTLHGVAPRQTRAAAGILRFADMVAAVSNEVRQQIVSHGLKAQRVEVVHNGVTEIPPLDDLTRATYDRELALDGPVIASVGRLAPEKAQDRFLAAAAIVLDSCPDATFLIVGDGPMRADLEKRAAELGIEHAVRFTGTRDDARLLIDRADIMVLSSDREGHSIAALEALAAGTPVVSTEVAGMRELLGTGAGLIVSSWQPRDLASGITALLADDARRLQMGAEGRRLVAKRFSVSAMEGRYASLYARLRE
jgi:glycosyltransferase involved in cell wall biosynthesis